MSEETQQPSSRIERRKQRKRSFPPSGRSMAQTKPPQEEPRTDRAPDEEERGTKPRRFARTRLIPIWLRLIIIAVLMAASLAIGAVVGYSAIGDGRWLDVFRPSTWQHILDFVEKGT
ncbi:DNA-directed RNA polymerase subunit beta [Geobacillus vulcani]|uniref:DNA-directed RNA polymerase subunit beta n=1 Tax=Geobacillus vulcani TaxID=135517 RepID=UPI0004DEF5AD|nr:DNA-directed RNA polymerase subunit beta [Geobacillus vulcani]